jgi:hypothetical protein
MGKDVVDHAMGCSGGSVVDVEQKVVKLEKVCGYAMVQS